MPSITRLGKRKIDEVEDSTSKLYSDASLSEIDMSDLESGDDEEEEANPLGGEAEDDEGDKENKDGKDDDEGPPKKKVRLDTAASTANPLHCTIEDLRSDDPMPIYRRMVKHWSKGCRKPQAAYYITETKKGSSFLTTPKVHAALAAVTYAKPDLNTIVDYHAVVEYPESGDFGTEETYENETPRERTKKLNRNSKVKRDFWPAAGGRRLIFPWQTKGHFVTIIATVERKIGGWHGWSLEYTDSLEMAANELKRLPENLVIMLRQLGWFQKWKVDDELLTDNEMTRISAGRQSGGTCGVHTIMNGWALALGLKLNPDFSSRDKISKYPGGEPGWWSVEAARMANLAMMGRMNAATIFLFFRAWHFIEDDSEISRHLWFDRTIDVGKQRGNSTKFYYDLVAKELGTS